MTSSQYRFWCIYGRVAIYSYNLVFILMFAVMFSILFMPIAEFAVCLWGVIIVSIVVMLMLLVACIFAKDKKILAALSGRKGGANAD